LSKTKLKTAFAVQRAPVPSANEEWLRLVAELARFKWLPGPPEGTSLSAMIMERPGRSTLSRAVGHVSGTAQPGQPGNVGMAGHRDTFCRPLRNIGQNDIITIPTLGGEYRYRVVSTEVVSPSDIGVLNPGESKTLTLVICSPLYFVGAGHQSEIRRVTSTLNLGPAGKYHKLIRRRQVLR
jgi:LPXTG-site transpeptidase (sortase) family protein